MPIKKRNMHIKPAPQIVGSDVTDYHQYRAMWWSRIDRTNFNYHSSRFESDGEVRYLGPEQFILQPKKILFFKDVWHCGSVQLARNIALDILGFDDVRFLELKGSWVYVDWNHQGKDYLLPGQPVEDRTKISG